MRRVIAIVIIIAAVTALHYTTPTSRIVYHEVYNRLYYIPIILGAFTFGLRGGIVVAIAISLIFLPHIFFQWGGFHAGNINMVTEILLYNAVGAVTGLLVSMERRHRREVEETGARLRESLRELEEKTNLLIQREEELRQSERFSLLGEMSAMMAHEIRNPLGSIKGAAEILSDHFRKGEDGYRYTEILVKEVDRLSSVIDNFIRAGAPRREQTLPIDLNELLKELLFFTERVAAKGRVTVSSQYDPHLGLIRGHPNQLRQAFMNLILNGIYAMERGGRLTIRTEKSDGGIAITFTDTGVGIPEEAMTELFKPFYTTRESGTGLGLTITKRIVEAHGGRIEISSEVGKGTAVRVTLP
ncbi:MAG: hypothetical protein A2Z06_03970, partial [Candidatus Glassbacteria bacterium RBG_16_58_8]